MSDLNPAGDLTIEAESRIGASADTDEIWQFISDPAGVLPLVGTGRMLGAGNGYALTEQLDGWLGEATAAVVDEDRRRVEYLLRVRGEVEPRVGIGIAVLELAPSEAPEKLALKLRLSAIGAEVDEAAVKSALERFLAEALAKAKAGSSAATTGTSKSRSDSARKGKGSGLHIANSFEVRVPVEDVWPALLDIERVAGYLPGATIEPGEEEGTYKGAMSIKLGPVKVGYSGTVRLVEVDEENRRAVMDIKAREKRGQGGVGARIVNQLVEQNGGTRVEVDTELQISGKQAQFGRGIMESVATRMLGDFARKFEQDLLNEAQAATSGEGPVAGDAVIVYEPPAWRKPALAGVAVATFVASILAWARFRKR